MRPLRYLNGRTLSPVPAEARQIHEHRFVEDSGGTLCEDNVRYIPLGGALINALFVEKDIQKIFAYRSDRLQNIFGEGPTRLLI